MADAKDKGTMYAEVFSQLYQYTDALQTQGMAASEHGPALHPMDISDPSDLKTIWTTSGGGGGL